MRKSLTRGLGLAILVVAAACKKEPPAPPAPNVVTIRTTDYAFTMPDTIPSGVTRLRLVNAGPALHHAALVRLTRGATMDTLQRFLSSPPGPPPAWLEWVGSPNAAAAADSVDVITDLTPGQYAAICFIPDSTGRPHFALGMMKSLTVVPATGPTAAEPTADLTVSLTDYDFTFSTPPAAGRRMIRVNNDGQMPHEIILARLDSGATAQQLVTWIRSGMRGRPPAYPAGGTVAIQPGGHAFIDMDLAPGTYAVLCLLPAPDGKEHVDHGMIKQITVS